MEVNRRSTVIHVKDSSHVGEARRETQKMGQILDLDDTRLGAAAIASTEIATNIIKHAGEGTIFIQEVNRNGSHVLQVLAVDKGPGIQDVSAALADGQSSSNTLGIGLGAMRRLADDFDIYSTVGFGTTVLCEFWKNGKSVADDLGTRTGVVSTPYPGEVSIGDGWIVKASADQQVFMLVDGLGHGALASDAAREAERIVWENQSWSPVTLLRDCHDALIKTRGAAVGIVTLDTQKGLLRFAGVGNIGGSIVSANSSRGLASHNGTLGHQMPRAQEFTYPWTSDCSLVMHSDGLTTKWSLNKYPGIWSKNPSLIAAVLYRDFFRGNDDVTVLVAVNRN